MFGVSQTSNNYTQTVFRSERILKRGRHATLGLNDTYTHLADPLGLNDMGAVGKTHAETWSRALGLNDIYTHLADH